MDTQHPWLALLLLGLFTPHTFAGRCFTSVASPINGYWTWGQTVSTNTTTLPLYPSKSTHRLHRRFAVKRDHAASPQTAWPPHKRIPPVPGIHVDPAWSQPGFQCSESQCLVALPLSDTERALHSVTECRVQMPHVDTHSCRDSHTWP